MKFLMYNEGVSFFPSAVMHNNFRLYDVQNNVLNPVAAGVVLLRRPEITREVLHLYGQSISLELTASEVFPDWVSRQENSGLSPQRKRCKSNYNDYDVFFFPFGQYGDFRVRGIGCPTDLTSTTLADLMVYIKELS